MFCFVRSLWDSHLLLPVRSRGSEWESVFWLRVCSDTSTREDPHYIAQFQNWNIHTFAIKKLRLLNFKSYFQFHIISNNSAIFLSLSAWLLNYHCKHILTVPEASIKIWGHHSMTPDLHLQIWASLNSKHNISQPPHPQLSLGIFHFSYKFKIVIIATNIGTTFNFQRDVHF